MDKRSIEYNYETGNAIMLSKDSGVPVGDYVLIVRDEVRSYILQLIANFEFIMYGHVQAYVEAIYGKKETTVNEMLKDLENRRMISTHYLDSHKFAMLSKRGKCITTGDPDAIPLRKPNIHDLMRQAYFAEYCKVRNNYRFMDFRNLDAYLRLYKSIRNRLCEKRFYNVKDKEGEGLYKVIMYYLEKQDKDFNRRFIRPGRCLEWEDIEKLKRMNRSEAREYIEQISRAPYFSASEYLDEQINLLESYLKLTEQEKTRAERDELSTLQNRDIYYFGMQEDGCLQFLLLDFGLKEEQIKNAILAVDKCIGRMHQYIPGIYYNFDFYVVTYSDEHANEVLKSVNSIGSKLGTAYNKMWEEFYDEGNGQFDCWKWVQNKYRYKNVPFYLKTRHVKYLDIKKYFEANRKASSDVNDKH